ncbi:MAG: hypothetical protein ACYTKD_05380 [Planctomycetota bacterium]
MGWAAAAESPRSAPRITYGPGRELAKLACREINESSSLAAGRANRGVFWTHNDSGSAPKLFAFGTKGEHLAALKVTGARARDWEDMASFSLGRRHFLLIGDVGDNNTARDSCILYIVPEPRLRPGRGGQEASVKPLQTIQFRYEDGPHNCESVAIDPGSRRIFLVSKEAGKACKLYALDWPTRLGRSELVAKPVASLTIPTTTAMDISPDGLRMVVLTYGDAWEYSRRPKEGWADACSRAPRRIRMPRRVQGESVCYGIDGRALYLTSECKGKNAADPSPLFEVPVVGAGGTSSR